VRAADDYGAVKAFFETMLAVDVGVYQEYHALIVACGKTYCRKWSPKCAECPLNRFEHSVSA
jgi:endonuclease-3 related protein